MRWLRSSVVVAGVVGGLAMMAGGCEYDHHDHYHERHYRPVGYRYEPYPERGRWERARDWDRRHEHRYGDDGCWPERRW